MIPGSRREPLSEQPALVSGVGQHPRTARVELSGRTPALGFELLVDSRPAARTGTHEVITQLERANVLETLAMTGCGRVLVAAG